MKDFSEDQRGICLEPEIFEVLFTYLERKLPSLPNIWGAGLNKRLGLEGQPLWKVYQEAHKRGMKSTDIYTLPEKDEYLYEKTRYGGQIDDVCRFCL